MLLTVCLSETENLLMLLTVCLSETEKLLMLLDVSLRLRGYGNSIDCNAFSSDFLRLARPLMFLREVLVLIPSEFQRLTHCFMTIVTLRIISLILFY